MDYKELMLENLILKDQIKFLKGGIEWMVEAHGESITEEYTDSKWTLKSYVSDLLMPEFDKIDHRNENKTKK